MTLAALPETSAGDGGGGGVGGDRIAATSPGHVSKSYPALDFDLWKQPAMCKSESVPISCESIDCKLESVP